jgi:hypothetical protein
VLARLLACSTERRAIDDEVSVVGVRFRGHRELWLVGQAATVEALTIGRRDEGLGEGSTCCPCGCVTVVLTFQLKSTATTPSGLFKIAPADGRGLLARAVAAAPPRPRCLKFPHAQLVSRAHIGWQDYAKRVAVAPVTPSGAARPGCGTALVSDRVALRQRDAVHGAILFGHGPAWCRVLCNAHSVSQRGSRSS